MKEVTNELKTRDEELFLKFKTMCPILCHDMYIDRYIRINRFNYFINSLGNSFDPFDSAPSIPFNKLDELITQILKSFELPSVFALYIDFEHALIFLG